MNKKTIALSIAVVVISGLITYAGLSMFVGRTAQTTQYTTPRVSGAAGVPTESNISPQGLEVKLAITSNQPTYTYGDTLTLQTTIRNASLTPLSYQFSNTCTGPDIYFNGEKASMPGLCGMAFTDVDLSPGEIITYDDDFTFKTPKHDMVGSVSWDVMDGLTEVVPGTYTVTAEWQGTASNTVTITVKK